MHHYRSDETDVFFASSVPTLSKSERPHIIINSVTGRVYLSNGGIAPGGADTFYLMGGGGGGIDETLIAARVLTAADNGKTFSLDLAAGFDVTLPALATTKFTCHFVVGISPTTAYTITGATADKIYGYVLSASGAAEDTAGVGDPGDVINFVANTALIGDRLTVTCNGTFYLAEGRCAAAGGITITG